MSAPDDHAVKEFENDFETKSVSNGGVVWLASDLMRLLGYETPKAFQGALNRAFIVCDTLKKEVSDHFQRFKNEDGGKDWKLTRFACFLVAMNGDPRKPKVAQAQAYFAELAEMVSDVMAETGADGVERVYQREVIKGLIKALTDVAQERGADVKGYAGILDAGYMGFYNMDTAKLREVKGIANYKRKRSPMDFMGTREMVANQFRLSQTEARISGDEQIRGQSRLEQTAKEVGQDVREVMMKTGEPPEKLAKEVASDIEQVKRGIRQVDRGMLLLDKKPEEEE